MSDSFVSIYHLNTISVKVVDRDFNIFPKVMVQMGVSIVN